MAPPGRGAASNTETPASGASRRRKWAAASPQMPPPTMATVVSAAGDSMSKFRKNYEMYESLTTFLTSFQAPR